MAMGRPAKPYVTQSGDIIPGLYHCPDGRWRINATGAKFTEHDERLAIKKFFELTRVAPETTTLPGVQAKAERTYTHPGGSFSLEVFRKGEQRQVIVETQELWDYFREALLKRPIHVATMTGLPELANWAQMQIPGKPLKLAEVWTYYERENTSKEKNGTKRVWDKMVEQTKATTLAELTKDTLFNFRQSVELDPKYKSGGTKAWIYGKVKAVLSFAKKSHDLDPVQIANALARCSVLWTASEIPENDPKPIDRTHLHKLLATAGNGDWRAWILMGLNCAMYIEELCDLKWENVDLEKGTLSMRRAKTKFPKVATLWPETIAALKQLRQAPIYVFTSPHGTRFQSSQSRCNEFAKIRERTEGVPQGVSFAMLRDGAYTAACRGTTGDDRIAKILAGHSSGMEDKYVLRSPEIVKPACDAVYAAYGPF